MSRKINNSEYRQNVIRELLLELHQGKSVDEVKAKFAAAFDGVSATEISEAEQALIEGGMPVEEVQRLCDVHAAVFRDSLQPPPKPEDDYSDLGHPVAVIKAENRALEAFIEGELKAALEACAQDAAALPRLREAISTLEGVNVHYLRKENLIFPYMERHGITAPPKVMWGVDDEIRGLIRQAAALSGEPRPDMAALTAKVEEAAGQISEMIYKEDTIMLPMLIEAFSQAEWKRIADESGEIGYFLIPTPPEWNPSPTAAGSAEADPLAHMGSIILPTGLLQLNQLTGMLDALPIDITFVDSDDRVKYFSQGAERVFPRTKAIIGRNVSNCHPPASVHIVEGILSDFKSGKKSHEDFWIKMGGKYIYIRYFAVRSAEGEYIGTLEVTQNIAPIQEITGEKRLVEG